MTDPFALLGVPRRFRLELRALEQTHRDLARQLHPDRFAGKPPAERRLAIERAGAVNEAFRALKSPLARASALLATVGLALEETARAEPALLTAVLELREELEEAKERREVPALEALRARVRSLAEEQESALVRAFDELEGADRGANEAALRALVSLKYYYRFLEEADAAMEAVEG